MRVTICSMQFASHEVWADETTDHKQDPDKRHQNLLQASGEVIERMNGAIWAGAPVIAVPGCSENIFHSSDVAKMTEFFDKSIAGVSINNAADWNITPQGWVYSTLKSQLRLHPCGPIDLRDVWVHIHSSRALRFSNKCFTFNKLGANLAGQERLVRSLSPVPDFCNCSIDENGRLDFHYLDYSATEEVYDQFHGTGESFPCNFRGFTNCPCCISRLLLHPPPNTHTH